MSNSIYIVDAFTCQPFKGNPAAVCLLDQPVDTAWMQSVASEINLSDTAFLLPMDDGEWNLRWFTPHTEVDLCGHATLAAAHILWSELGQIQKQLVFHSPSGLLKASREPQGIMLDFPIDHLIEQNIDQSLIDALGIRPEMVFRGREDLLAVYPSAQQVRTLSPDQAALSKIACRGLIATAPGDENGVDFISRFFAPALGIPEDPVTGSAHCTLAPYWSNQLGKQTLKAYQASQRGGEIEIRMRDQRVMLIGQTVTIIKGKLHV
ncbi:MAG: PhzF family phenazine biosynthesis protein [Candidatus Thiodiazotropha lotti]|uniref:Oxidoreductase n=1 Tax=Candidatus Thiodiazotropha endoloripes TaxID=1818881 RepID=A0A1E2USX0_9GAMM|nr:PhzF family phenazine biosynthesis protein [Candidatus Thiodiazotropha endoloripes]MCG7899464.1 PhzF family phenazine biosynthesis protein [Candidatus Thiodiazotropha weberae]MCG7999406.1 PhzF family phenazine biosynthesis protein [Candidatus Thiodiazotropha lotti]MCG7901368.1 PhzF family phenazine biosynthesis protein [Candidatus Thiodiazotropha weberae]MCG7915991.1 PhzF family phenazine biosynthesis protein [Candidatus Thiodiazotropha weberae]MCW4191174.1 PhzF family phenazine biosynthesi